MIEISRISSKKAKISSDYYDFEFPGGGQVPPLPPPWGRQWLYNVLILLQCAQKHTHWDKKGTDNCHSGKGVQNCLKI
jgi:hypothetical protein